MSNVMTITKMKKNEEVENTDSEIIPVKKKELIARLEGDEIKYKACYKECVKHAITAKSSKEEANLYKQALESMDQHAKVLKNENDILKNELSIYRSKTNKTAKEIESKKMPTKTADDFNKDVEDGFLAKEQERLEKIKKDLQERYFGKK